MANSRFSIRLLISIVFIFFTNMAFSRVQAAQAVPDEHFFQKSNTLALHPKALAERVECYLLNKRLFKHYKKPFKDAPTRPGAYAILAVLMALMAATGVLFIWVAFVLGYCGTGCYQVLNGPLITGTILAVLGLVLMVMMIVKGIKAGKARRRDKRFQKKAEKLGFMLSQQQPCSRKTTS